MYSRPFYFKRPFKLNFALKLQPKISYVFTDGSGALCWSVGCQEMNGDEG